MLERVLGGGTTGNELRVRDAALRRSRNVNRWLLAGSLTLTAIFAEVAAHAIPGKTIRSAPSRAGARSSSASEASSTPPLKPPAQAPEPAPSEQSTESSPSAEPQTSPEVPSSTEPEAQSSPEVPSSTEPAPSSETSAPVEESAPAVVSGGS